MKTITLFSFAELSAEAQDTAVRLAKLKYLFAPNFEIDRDDAFSSFSAIVKELDFEVGRNGINHHQYISDDIAGHRLRAKLWRDYGHIFPKKMYYTKSGKSRASKILREKYPEISGYWSDAIILAPLTEFLECHPNYPRDYNMGMLIRDISISYGKLIEDLWDYYTNHGVEQLLRESDDIWFTEDGILVEI